MTRTGSGASTSLNTVIAATEAVKKALGGVQKAQIGLLFAGPKHDLGAALAAAREASPGTDFLGCHTAGEFTEGGLTHGGIAAMLISGDDLVYDLQIASGLKNSYETAARRLCQNFAATAKAAAAKGLGLSTTVMLVDGLCGTGEKVVREVMSGTRMFQQIVGGAAGDEGAFKATHVGARRESAPDTAAAVHIFDKTQWGVGVDHGLRPTTERMTVTKASANVVAEIDGKPAFEVYKAYAKGRGVELTPETAGKFLIGNELGLYFLDQLTQARAPLAVGPKGELTLAAEISEGSSVCILDGEPEAMTQAARRAALEAFGNLKGRPAAGVLVFDCVCRGMILDKEFQKEIDAIRSVFPGVPVAGFLTYGEIARFKGKLDGWHNTTAVVAAIPA